MDKELEDCFDTCQLKETVNPIVRLSHFSKTVDKARSFSKKHHIPLLIFPPLLVIEHSGVFVSAWVCVLTGSGCWPGPLLAWPGPPAARLWWLTPARSVTQYSSDS